MRRRQLICLVAVGLSTVLLAACGVGDSGGVAGTPSSAASDPVSASAAVDAFGAPLPERPECAADADGQFVVATTTEGHAVGLLLLGTGVGGIVLAPHDNGDICQWLPFAKRLARSYRVALFGWADPRPEVMLEAVAALRGAGARDVVLGGASYGGALAMSEAHRVKPAPAGVLSLGGEIVLPNELDGRDGIKRWDGPLLAIGSEDDDFFNSANAEQLRRLHPGPETILMLTGTAHGVELLAGPDRAQVRDAIDSYLARILT